MTQKYLSIYVNQFTKMMTIMPMVIKWKIKELYLYLRHDMPHCQMKISPIQHFKPISLVYYLGVFLSWQLNIPRESACIRQNSRNLHSPKPEHKTNSLEHLDSLFLNYYPPSLTLQIPCLTHRPAASIEWCGIYPFDCTTDDPTRNIQPLMKNSVK